MDDAQKKFIEIVKDHKECWKDIYLAYHLYYYNNKWYCLYLRATLRHDLNMKSLPQSSGIIVETKRHLIASELISLDRLEPILVDIQESKIDLAGRVNIIHEPISDPERPSSPQYGPRRFRWVLQELDRESAIRNWGVFYNGQVFSLFGQAQWDQGFPSYSDYDEEDKKLYASKPPWDGVNDVGLSFFSNSNFTNRNRETIISFLAPLPIVLDDQFSWEPDRRLKARVSLGPGIDPLKCRINLFGKGKSNTREMMIVIDKPVKAPKTLDIAVPVNDDTFAKVMVLYGQNKVDSRNVWLPHPEKGNPCIMMLSAFDWNLASFRDQIGFQKKDSEGFEKAVAWLFAMNGFIIAHLTGMRLHSPPDVLAYSNSPPAIIVIECTTTAAAAMTKVQDVAVETKAVFQQVPDEIWTAGYNQWNPEPLVASVIASPLAENELVGAREEAAKRNVVVIGIETIQRWFNYGIIKGSTAMIIDELKRPNHGAPNYNGSAW
jgi:hypothetical protein